jgi:hypothetical protein
MIRPSFFSAAESDRRLKLIVSRRFGLTIHTGSKRKGEDSKTEAIHFPRPGQESSAADMEDIEIDADRCPFASSSNT